MTKEETAFRKRLEALPQMTNREAMEIVLEAARAWARYHKDGKKILEATYQMEDYKNDLMIEEPATGCDYGIGG